MFPLKRPPLIAAGCLLVAALGTGLYLYKNRTKLPPKGKAEVAVFVTRPKTLEEAEKLYTRALYEPLAGCLLGAYIDLDPLLKQTFRDQNNKVRKLPEEFEKIVGKKHAVYFFYLGYGMPLPMDWVKRQASQGRMVHIALEPNEGLDKVVEDGYLTQLAKDMGASGAKIFLRYASEMNGPWVKYHGDPAKYIEKWRLVTRVMRQYAPNVAMLWCPYTTPKRYIRDYYPGDDVVDWVGVNLYSVTFYSQDPSQPAHDVHPVDKLNWVYREYSARKPIMICEYGATHFSALESTPNVEFARRCILSLYSALPRMYPRVKSITYFNSNNLQVKHRKNNNYSVTDDPEVLAAYKEAIKADYFLSGMPDDKGATQPVPVRLVDGDELRGTVELSGWGRSPGKDTLLKFYLGGKMIHRGDTFENWKFSFNTATVPDGPAKLTVHAFNPDGDLVATDEVQVVIRNRP